MRYFMHLSYDGSAYHGWQIQPNGESVEGTIEKLLSTVLREEIDIVGAGRTDAGVNAAKMVAHFDYDGGTDVCSAEFATKFNRFLPADISITKIEAVKADAHARFDAKSRTYKYYVSTSKSPFNRHYTYYFQQPLDFGRMNEAALKLLDYTDFTSFSKLHTDVKTNDCKVTHAAWEKASDTEWVFTITANRFLRNMVRAIVGTLLEVGRGRLTTEQFCHIIEKKDRCSAGSSVPGNALFLYDIEY